MPRLGIWQMLAGRLSSRGSAIAHALLPCIQQGRLLLEVNPAVMVTDNSGSTPSPSSLVLGILHVFPLSLCTLASLGLSPVREVNCWTRGSLRLFPCCFSSSLGNVSCPKYCCRAQ